MRPLRLGAHGGGIHLTATADDDRAQIFGPDGEVVALSRRGGGYLADWLLDWARPNRRLRLWGAGDILAALRVSPATLHAWRKRRDFPKPVAETSNGPIWEERTVRAWERDCRPRRGPRPKMRKTRR